MNTRRAFTRVVVLLLVASALTCAPDGVAHGGDADGAEAGPFDSTAQVYRGDVSYPGLPAIGVKFVIGEDDARLVAAPNMGFGGGPLERYRVEGDSILFSWSLTGDSYHCILRRQDDGIYVGPCTSVEGEPTFGMRKLPAHVDGPVGLSRTMLEMSSVQWYELADGITSVRVASENADRVLLDSVRVAERRARADNAAIFGDVVRTIPIDVFFVGDREMMARVVGRPVGGWTDPLAGTVVLVGYGEHDVALRHELTHAISYNAWGPPREGAAWLAEGVATWIAGDCAGFALHDLASDMGERGELVPMRALLDEFHEQNDIVAYLQSGSVVGYLIDTHGVDAFRRVWTAGEDGLRAIGLDAEELERDWLNFIEARAARPVDREIIRTGGCG